MRMNLKICQTVLFLQVEPGDVVTAEVLTVDAKTKLMLQFLALVLKESVNSS